MERQKKSSEKTPAFPNHRPEIVVACPECHSPVGTRCKDYRGRNKPAWPLEGSFDLVASPGKAEGA